MMQAPPDTLAAWPPSAGARVRAPELAGRGGWLNTGGATLALARPARQDRAARLLDLLLHQLPARPRRAAPARGAVRRRAGHRRRALAEVRARGRPEALAAAVERYGVRHPVLDDPDLDDLAGSTPSAPGRRWSLVDPEGYVVAQLSGEGHAHALDALVAELVAEHEAQGHAAPRRRAVRRRRRRRRPTLRFPGKAVVAARRHPAGRRHRAPPAGRARRRRRDRAAPDRHRRARAASTARPTRRGSASRRACACCRPRSPAEVGLRRGRRRHRQPRAARGAARRRRGPHGRRHRRAVDAGRTEQRPGDAVRALVAVGRRLVATARVVVAMAGIHQLWTFDPVAGDDRALAPAPRNEGLRRRPARPRRGSPRPSGLAAARTATRLWLADARDLGAARGSTPTARRAHRRGHGAVRLRPRRRPGRAGAAAAPARRHGAARRLGRGRRHLQRRGAPLRPGDRRGHAPLATGLAEPSGVLVLRRRATGWSWSSRPRTGSRGSRCRTRSRVVDGSPTAPSARSPRSRPASVELEVVFEPPAGQKLDDRYGPSTRLVVVGDAAGAAARRGRRAAPSCTARLVLRPGTSATGVLHVAARAASCDDRRPRPSSRPATSTSRTGVSRSGPPRTAARG